MFEICQGLQKARGLCAVPLPVVEDELLPGPRHRDVEEPPLFFDVSRLHRLPPRENPLVALRQDHQGELQALAGVHREKLDALLCHILPPPKALKARLFLQERLLKGGKVRAFCCELPDGVKDVSNPLVLSPALLCLHCLLEAHLKAEVGKAPHRGEKADGGNIGKKLLHVLSRGGPLRDPSKEQLPRLGAVPRILWEKVPLGAVHDGMNQGGVGAAFLRELPGQPDISRRVVVDPGEVGGEADLSPGDGNPELGKAARHPLGAGVGPQNQRGIPGIPALVQVGPQNLGLLLGLLKEVCKALQLHLPGPLLCRGDLLGQAVLILRDDLAGGGQNRLLAPVVDGEGHLLRPGAGGEELLEDLGIGAPKAVDRLVIVPHDEEVLVACPKEEGDLKLHRVDVLELVHQDVVKAGLLPLQDVRAPQKKLPAGEGKVVKVHEVHRAQVRRIAAACIGKNRVLRKGKIVQGPVLHGRDCRHEVQDVPLLRRLLAAVPKEPLQDFCLGIGGYKGKLCARVGLQNPEKQGVKGAKEGFSAKGRGFSRLSEFPKISLFHLLRGRPGEGEDEDPVRGNVLLLDQKQDVLHQGEGLSAPGAGKAEHGPCSVGNSPVLRGVSDRLFAFG